MVQEKKRKYPIGMILANFDLQVIFDFQNGQHDGHLGFLSGMILAIFDLQVTLIIPIKSEVN